MLQLTHGTHRKVLPDSWEAAGPIAWQLLRDMCRLPPGAGKLSALRRLTGLTAGEFERFSPDEVAALDCGTPWLGITAIDTPLRSRMTCGLRTYWWPDTAFLDGQTLAFTLADEYYLDALGEEGEAAADAQLHLLACLAVPRDGIRRRLIRDRAEVEDRAHTFRRLPPEWQAQSLMYWTGVKMKIHELYGELLFKEDDSTDGPRSTAPHFGWPTTLQDVAQAGAFGNLRAVQDANLHEVLQYLARREGQRRDEIRLHESLKNKH